MTKKIDWKQELQDSAKFNEKEEKLLKQGTKSLVQSWHLGALYTRWKKLKEIREKTIPNLQSSFIDWEKRLRRGDFYILLEEELTYPDW
tara:strand:- start:393 stop:659 length:267 start_codon:yes stop_codon:yes gene_type:complete